MADDFRSQLLASLGRWRDDPVIMVRELFGTEPDAWQADVLRRFRTSPRIALLASKGVGKTTLLAWVIWLFMLTRINPKIACISIDANNLRDNLWSELALWRSKAPLLEKLFEMNSKAIFSKEPGMERIWFCAARSWKASGSSQEQASSLSGLHADNIMFVIDESGAMPDGILASAENALSTAKEGHIVQAGNPERLEGPLYRASQSKNNWLVVPINGDPDNPNRSPRVPIEWAQDQIREWGRESDFVKINVLGQFPSTSANALMGMQEVEDAMSRFYREYQIGDAPRIMGIDVGLSETGDPSVIAKRQGIQMLPFMGRRGLNSTQGTSWAIGEWDSWGADACFVDATGGYGVGWIDQMTNMGKAPVGVKFNSRPNRPDAFNYKRSEMAWDFVQWVRKGGALPNSPELKAALTRTLYTHEKDKFVLEPKDMVRARLGYSPDDFDAAILTFAEPVSIRRGSVGFRRQSSAVTAYDPFAEMKTGGQQRSAAGEYDPFGSGRYLP